MALSIYGVAIATAAQTELEVRRFSTAEYHAMADVLENGPRVELLDGVICVVMTQGPRHRTAVVRLTRVLTRQLGDAWQVLPGVALSPADGWEPEPDLSVIPAELPAWQATTAALVIEISGSSLPRDRGVKLHAYAEAGVGEYWIVDLIGLEVAVHRRPDGDDYRERTVHASGGLRSTAVPELEVDLDPVLTELAGIPPANGDLPED